VKLIILGAIVQNLVATVTWQSELDQPVAEVLSMEHTSATHDTFATCSTRTGTIDLAFSIAHCPLLVTAVAYHTFI
jgi:hypothetical protein